MRKIRIGLGSVRRGRLKGRELVLSVLEANYPGLNTRLGRELSRLGVPIDDCDDIISEVFLRFWNYWSSREPDSSQQLAGWLSTVTHHVYVNWLRGELRERRIAGYLLCTDEQSFLSGDRSDREDQPEEEKQAAVSAAISELADRERRALTMVDGGLTPDAAALALGVTRPHFYVILSRAKAKIKRFVQSRLSKGS